MSARPNPEAVVVFGREPVPGRVKTRLAAAIGPERACEVYRDLLARTLRTAAEVDAARYLDLPPGDRVDPSAWVGGRFAVREQRGANLGERMDRAFRDCFEAGHQRVVLIGSDCPALTPRHLRDGLAALVHHETVFGPAADGGYYLVAQRPPARDLFTGIPWSTGKVWAQTRRKLEAGGTAFALLETLEDVDDEASLRRWIQSSPIETNL